LSVTQQQVLDSLARIKSPRGVALANANVLSAISASDGKVFFSINVDAAEARAWESVRAEAEAAVRAIPGVTTVMVSFTASNTITTVGRIMIASGMPTASGLGGGKSSISRTMS